MSGPKASRRGLLRALTAMPIAGIPVPAPHIPADAWHAVVQALREVEAETEPFRERFDAAEALYFADTSNLLAKAKKVSAWREYVRALERCDVARDAVLDTRAPDVSAIIFKFRLIGDHLWPEVIEALRFFEPDLRALEAAHFMAIDGGES